MENLLETPFVYWDGAVVDDPIAAMNHDFSDTHTYDEDGYISGTRPVVPEGINLLIAVYTYECYNGKAFVLYEHHGKLFEVNGSHCSCMGLEGQFLPEETSWEALFMRDFADSWFTDFGNPWNTMNLRIEALAAEHGVFPKEPKSALELQAWDFDADEFPF